MEDSRVLRRTHLLGICLMVLGSLIVLRLFYLQVIRHSYYEVLANEEQLRKFEVQPDRGEIYFADRSQQIPAAMNRTLKRVYVDPRFVKDRQETAQELADILKGSAQKYAKNMDTDSYYVVVADKVDPRKAKMIADLELPGVGVQDQPTRVYPEESLAAQLLGFVNSDGEGQYGIEETYNEELSGQVGLLNATTDTKGIPIATSDNYKIPPHAGSDIVLTIDRNIQTKVEEILEAGMQKYSATGASALIIDPSNGAVLAMANFPTFRPDRYSEASDFSVFQNRTVNGLYEPGSVIKSFTMAAALDTGSVTPDTTYLDSGSVRVGDRVIENARGIPTGVHTMRQVIEKSINTGVVYALSSLGGGQINQAGKEKLHEYFVDKFDFGKLTGVDLVGEGKGTIFEPDTADVDYANMSFGQAMTATMLQVVSGYAAIANGGKLYQPYVVDQIVSSQGRVSKTEPRVKKENILNPATMTELKKMWESVIKSTGDAVIDGYRFGGKSGTAQIPNPAGGYFENRDIGSFVGVAPLEKPAFVVMVRIDEPQIGTFASAAARPMAGDIARWTLNYLGIKPSR